MNLIDVLITFTGRLLHRTDEDDILLSGEHDLQEINERINMAIVKLGRTRSDIGLLFGLDPKVRLIDQDPKKLPPASFSTLGKISGHLGISIRWMLYGEASNAIDLFVMGVNCTQEYNKPFTQPCNTMGGTQGSAVVQGNERSTIIVKNISGEALNEHEREALRVFRSLCTRDQTRLLNFAYELEDAEN